MTYIPKRLRELVIERARRRCEYCQAQMDIIIEMKIDHIKPVVEAGQTVETNLALAGSTCNGRKLDFATGVDPASGKEVELFNPRTQLWMEHFEWVDDGLTLTGLTAFGRATIQRLKLNSELR